MAADSSIYGLVRGPRPMADPLQQAGQAMQIRNLMGAGELQGLQRQQMEQQIRMQPELARQAAEDRARKIAGEDATRSKTQAEAFAKNLATMRDLTAQARSDADMPLLRDSAVRIFGPDLASKMNIPQRYDPAWQQAQITSAEELLKRVMPAPPAGHTMQPGGGLSPIDPEYLKGREAIARAGKPQINTNILPPQKTFENEDKLRSDYTANPMVKSSSELQNAFNLIETAYKRPSAANDLAMATKYMKILDPTSVVRESEFALAVNATGLLDKTMNYAAQIVEGKKLNPAQRKDFYDSAKAINEAFQKEREKVDNQYSEMAKGYGLNPKNVVPSLRNPKPAAAATPGGKPKFLGFE